jgi:hypothetical protein
MNQYCAKLKEFFKLDETKKKNYNNKYNVCTCVTITYIAYNFNNISVDQIERHV